jgi:hypothetical protein
MIDSDRMKKDSQVFRVFSSFLKLLCAQVARHLIRRWVRLTLTRPDWEAFDARWAAVLACKEDTEALSRLDRCNLELQKAATGDRRAGSKMDTSGSEARKRWWSTVVDGGWRRPLGHTSVSRLSLSACGDYKTENGEADRSGAPDLEGGVFQAVGGRRESDLDHLYEQVGWLFFAKSIDSVTV